MTALSYRPTHRRRRRGERALGAAVIGSLFGLSTLLVQMLGIASAAAPVYEPTWNGFNPDATLSNDRVWDREDFR